ncbi:acyl-CoA carboxylase subunit epsilon [Microbacterium atlanticum]|uniref:acyl-CoA carboxylase subunit epsilon n=1 Tax=Microbacterium atlanticum TaxID=2782168 RepID=UPI001886DD85|nr:acyl-CoA carboxylase subunit epsilon [Microbacterium atlanticum]
MSIAEDGSQAGSVRIDVLRGAATEEELAALIAVVSEAYVGEAAEAVADDSARRSAWSLSQRALRLPLQRELGWGRFGGR